MKRFILDISIRMILCLAVLSSLYGKVQVNPAADSTDTDTVVYDPFGPENSPDYSGHGSGGVLTPSPYDDVIQTFYTRISSDYLGIQNMLDCPWQFSAGLAWASYHTNIYGVLFKIRSTGLKQLRYDPVVEDYEPIYHLPFEAAIDYNFNDTTLYAYKIRVHYESFAKSLGMAGIGALIARGNLMVARDLPMNRQLDIEFTWIQIAGGYIMPLSPRLGGVNTALCLAVDLLGAKHQSYASDGNKFYGAKIGSVGWLAGFGWNATDWFNLGVYVGGEWSFSTGGLKLPQAAVVRADLSRNTLHLGTQITMRYFNLVGGIQKEWESLDYQKTVTSEKSLRYYFGFDYYIRR